MTTRRTSTPAFQVCRPRCEEKLSRIDSESECVILMMELGAVVRPPTATASGIFWSLAESHGTQLPPSRNSLTDRGETRNKNCKTPFTGALTLWLLVSSATGRLVNAEFRVNRK